MIHSLGLSKVCKMIYSLDLPKVVKMSSLRQSALNSIYLRSNHSAVPKQKVIKKLFLFTE